MTINEAIAKVDGLCPNAYTEAQKVAWLSEVDGRVALDISKVTTAPVAYAWPDDGDTALLVPFPYDNMYELYVISKINFHNGEFDQYNATAKVFKDAYDEYAARIRRVNAPTANTGFQVM